MQTNDLFHDLRTNEEIYKQLHNQTAEMDSLDSTFVVIPLSSFGLETYVAHSSHSVLFQNPVSFNR